MLTQKQKKVATSAGLGLATLGTVLLVRHHHKDKKKSSKHHQLTKEEFLKDEARGAERERKYLERKLHLGPIIRRLKRESKPEHITDYGNGLHCDKKGCHVDWNEACHDIGDIIYHGWIDSIGSSLGDMGSTKNYESFSHAVDILHKSSHR